MLGARMHAWAAIATVFAASSPVLAAPAPAPSASLRILVPNVQPKGPVVVQIYRDAGAWAAGGQPMRRVAVEVVAGFADTRLQLPGDAYAAVAFQDLNGNGQLDTWAFGIPKEPVGYSGGKRPFTGRPKFDDALFLTQAGERTTVFVRLK